MQTPAGRPGPRERLLIERHTAVAFCRPGCRNAVGILRRLDAASVCLDTREALNRTRPLHSDHSAPLTPEIASYHQGIEHRPVAVLFASVDVENTGGIVWMPRLVLLDTITQRVG